MAENTHDSNGNGWDEYKRLVLSEIRRIANFTQETRDKMDEHCRDTRDQVSKEYKELSTQISTIKADIRALQIKAGVWGLMGGAIPVGIALLVWVIERMS